MTTSMIDDLAQWCQNHGVYYRRDDTLHISTEDMVIIVDPSDKIVDVHIIDNHHAHFSIPFDDIDVGEKVVTFEIAHTDRTFAIGPPRSEGFDQYVDVPSINR